MEEGEPQHRQLESEPQDIQGRPIKVELGARRRWQEDAVAYCATIVAIAALSTSIWQAHLSAKHNRLSVRPLLRASTDFGAAFEVPGLFLKNQGVGPAIISSAHLYLDGNLQGEMQDEHWDELLIKSGLANSIFLANYSLENGSAMEAGKTHQLFVIPKGWPRDRESGFKDLVHRRLGVAICYCSLYEECWRLVMMEDVSSTDRDKCGLRKLKRAAPNQATEAGAKAVHVGQ